MAGEWIRKQDGAPSVRTIVIRYNSGACENSELEQLLAQIPYGLANKTWLECLRAGTKAMLRKLDQQASQTQTPVLARDQAQAQGKASAAIKAEAHIRSGRREAPFPARASTAVLADALTDPLTDTPGDAPARTKAIRSPLLGDGKTTQTQDEPTASDAPAAGFSKAARRMFDQ